MYTDFGTFLYLHSYTRSARSITSFRPELQASIFLKRGAFAVEYSAPETHRKVLMRRNIF